MADGLLLSRRERLRAYWQKAGIVAAPSLALALAAVALGAPVVALAVAILAGLAALATASSVRSRWGAAAAGGIVAVLLLGFQLVIAWMISHPILPGS